MRRRLLFVIAALTMILSVFAPLASAGDVAASDFTVADGDSITLDSVFSRAAVVDRNGQKLVSVIVKLAGEPLASYRGDISGLPATSPSVTGDAKLDTDSLNARRYRDHLARQHDSFERSLKSALPGSEITRRFDLVLGGVSALVPIDEVKTVEALDGVEAVWIDQMVQMDTDTSPAFIGATEAWDALGGVDEAGDGVIVGILDSGIWPEHPSMADDGTFAAPPAKWSGTECNFGNTAVNPDDAPFTCNNKLIGAADFTQTYVAVQGLLPTEFESARDSNGHGTHTATTSGGNSGVVSTVLGANLGVVSGIAPRAHVAVYKVCGAAGCFNSDTTAGVQQAVADGVDTINYSISGGGDPYGESTSIAFWHAFQAGIIVTPSAGNSGPGADTVAHREPWTMTVGASTHTRTYESTATLSGVAKGYDSQITMLHGIPDLPVDVYVDGALTLPGFAFGDDAGPFDLPPGDYAVDIFAEGADPDVDDPALSAVVPVALGVNATVVAHLDADGAPTAGVFGNDDSATASGEGRLSVSHTAAAPAVDIVLADDTVVFGNLANGERQSADLPAGTYDVFVTPMGAGSAGAVAGPLPVEVVDGVVRNVFAVGDLAGGTFGVDIIDVAPVTGPVVTLDLVGNTITGGIATPTAVTVPTEDPLCLEPFPAGRFNGEIVICERGVIARVAKSFNVAEGGASGMLFYNPVLQGTALDNHFIPTVHFEYTEGAMLTDFFATHSGVTATFTDGAKAPAQGDVMASFSSRGGAAQSLGISKPDITAPGVQINAGHTPMPESVTEGVPGQLFQVIGGTSMSAPHANGVAALVKQSHPEWSPSQIKSAIMLTALTDGVTKEDGTTPADSFDYGSGRVMPAKAIDSPLTMHTDGIDYVTHADNLWNTNYPSIYVPTMPGHISTQRTFTNTLGSWEIWNLSVDAPSDLVVDTPRRFYVRPNGSTTINIGLDASAVPLGETRFAALYLSNGADTLRMPITIVRDQPVVALSHTCESDELEVGDTMLCTIEVENTSLNDADVDLTWRAPRQLDVLDVYGARLVGGTTVKYSETLAGAEPPTPTISDVPGTSPAGYLPMSALGVGPESPYSDEQITNYNVPGFVYGGVTYSQFGVVSNGYIVVGGGDGGDVNFINSPLPDLSPPNNTLAPFWTDLDPSKGGNIYVALVGDGTNSWLVVEFEDVPVWSNASQTNTFQVWIGVNGTEDITYTYGDIGGGDGGFVTVGAEDATGTRGDMIFFDGVGTAPVSNVSEFRVSSLPGSPGGVHAIEIEVEGQHTGMFKSVAQMTSDVFYGTSTAVVEGEVVGGVPPRVPIRR